MSNLGFISSPGGRMTGEQRLGSLAPGAMLYALIHEDYGPIARQSGVLTGAR